MKDHIQLGPVRIRYRRDRYSSWGNPWVQLGGLALMTKTNNKGGWNLAAYHSWHSLTWRWILAFNLPVRGQGRWRPTFWTYRDNSGRQWGFGIVKFYLQWHSQQPMWYRHMYARLSDETEQRAGRMWLSDKHPHKIHTEGPLPTPTAPGSMNVH